MHREVLTPSQINLLPLISGFSRDYFLAGETAVAIHIGHRRSIDFDLFTGNEVRRKSIKNKLAGNDIHYEVLHEAYDQIHIMIGDVKITFLNYPYTVPHEQSFEKIITIPELIDLAAMKAFALGGRAKWKDYVDMYFIIKYHHSINEIDYSETVILLLEKPGEEEIKQLLSEAATEAF